MFYSLQEQLYYSKSQELVQKAVYGVRLLLRVNTKNPCQPCLMTACEVVSGCRSTKKGMSLTETG